MTSSMCSTSQLPIKRLLLVGVLMPAVFSGLDHGLLTSLNYYASDLRVITLVMAAFVVQVGLMGWLCGSLLDNPWWRWGLYIWCWVLVDLQLLSVSVVTNTGGSRYGGMLPGALYAAQVGLCTIWAILGTTRWMIRLPACAVLGTLLAVPQHGGYQNEFELMFLQMIALGALCLLLRWRRFKLMQIEPASGATPLGPPSGKQAAQMQFSIRHVLIWTSTMAVVLGILRALDLLSIEALLPYAQFDFIFLASAGLLVAAVFVIAFWAALGAGPWWLRLAVLLLALPAVGMVLAVLSWNAERIRYYPGSDFTALWTSPWGWQSLWDFHHWLLYWVALAGSLLFASLLIHRAIGLRLIRTVRRPARGSAATPAQLAGPG